MLDRIEAEASETVAHADICVDGRLLADYAELRERLMAPGGDKAELTGRFAVLHAEVEAKTHRYTFRCLDRIERERLKDQHPPTDVQKQRRWDYDPHGYEPALAAASLVTIDGEPVEDPPERVVGHFKMLYRTLPEGQQGWGLIAAALASSNVEGTQVPFSVRAIGDRLVSALNSTTQRDTESG